MQIVNSLMLLRGAGRHTRLAELAIYQGRPRQNIGPHPKIPVLEASSLTLNDILLWVAAGGAVLACLLGLAACLRPSGGPARLDALLEGLERTERALRADIAEGQRGLRGELAESARALRAELGRPGRAARRPGARRPGRPRRVRRIAGPVRRRLRRAVAGADPDQRASSVRSASHRRPAPATAAGRHGAKLDEMRRTVDEKLHATLEQRLGESFKLVSERLEAVHRAWAKCRRWPPAWAISSAC